MLPAAMTMTNASSSARGRRVKFTPQVIEQIKGFVAQGIWPAPGSEDTELGVLMELEVGHGETEVYPGVQA
jgi:hypothetical protein